MSSCGYLKLWGEFMQKKILLVEFCLKIEQSVFIQKIQLFPLIMIFKTMHVSKAPTMNIGRQISLGGLNKNIRSWG